MQNTTGNSKQMKNLNITYDTTQIIEENMINFYLILESSKPI